MSRQPTYKYEEIKSGTWKNSRGKRRDVLEQARMSTRIALLLASLTLFCLLFVPATDANNYYQLPQYFTSWTCPGYVCSSVRPYCMQGCVNQCGCCIPCGPYLKYGQQCSRTWSYTSMSIVPGLCEAGLLCDQRFGVCLPKSPYYNPVPPFPYYK